MTIVEQLRDLKTRVETYGQRVGQLTALKADIETNNDFRLGESESALYAQTLGGLELAKAVDKPLRAAVDRSLKAASGEFSRATSRVQSLHNAIDGEIKRRVIASLPEDLSNVEVVTGDLTINVTEAFASKVAAPSKLHIAKSKQGAAEFAARVDPVSVSMRAYFDPGAPLLHLVQLLDTAIKALEKLGAEETRCNDVLAKYQKAA